MRLSVDLEGRYTGYKTIQYSTFKIYIIKVGLVFQIFKFFIKKSSLAIKWMSLSYSNSDLDNTWRSYTCCPATFRRLEFKKREARVRSSHLAVLGAYLIPLTCYGAGNLARVNRLIFSRLSGLWKTLWYAVRGGFYYFVRKQGCENLRNTLLIHFN